MFRKSTKTAQLDLFTSQGNLLSGKSQKLYEDQNAWHNQFRKQVTMRIDESLFLSLYCEDNGKPNAPIRILLAMMVLKEAEGLSDQKIFENCRFNMLTRSAIGLLNADDPVPTESTYYLFRKRVHDHARKGNDNLIDKVFAQVTEEQCLNFEVSGKRIRMDSKLLGSNIAWLSRYELVHETLRLFHKEVKQSGKLDIETQKKLDDLLKLEGNKVVYTCSNEEVRTRLLELGVLIYKILPLFENNQSTCYLTLKRVFNEQFKIDAGKMVVAREKEEISAKSVQSPHDPDCNYRNKDGNKVKGYSVNVTESCDDDKGLNLIGNVDIRTADSSDVDFLQDGINAAKEVFTEKPEHVHADGAYHSPENQTFCKENNINLFLHAIQGAKGRYQFTLMENGELSIFDTETNQFIDVRRLICKNEITKWRIQTDKGYRYFTQKEIDTYLLRKQIEDTPVETLQKRNNVEATIFQLGYHYSNAKTRYRGLIKHQMWANIRCLWVNFVRISKYIKQTCQGSSFFADFLLKYLYREFFLALKSFSLAFLPVHLPSSGNIKVSAI